MFFPTGETSTTMYFIYALTIFLILYAVYRSFFGRLSTAEDYVKRANVFVQYFRAHKKAISTLEEGLRLPGLKEYQAQELHLRLGVQHFRLRDFHKATEHFDHVIPRLAKRKLAYDPGYLDMIMSYYNIGDVEAARSIYHKLLKKQYEDARFGMVTSLDNRIFK